jgi:hypothetical protein
MRRVSASAIERTIKRTPISPWLLGAVASIPLSLTLFAKGKKLAGILVGLWTPTLLNASLYNRLLKAAT